MQLSLLGEFRLADSTGVVPVAPASARVIAYLCLTIDRSAPRRRIARSLWPDREQGRAMANLRSALWRLPERAQSSVVATGDQLQTPSELQVDIDKFRNDKRLGPSDIVDLTAPLLPCWYDEWVIREREHFDLRRIETLERSAEACAAEGRFVEALDMALAAIELEPYRESTHRIVLESHLREGHTSEAVDHYAWLKTLFNDELGLRLSDSTQSLMRSVTVPRRTF